MKIIKINPKKPNKLILDFVSDELKKGKTIIYPTETCYGLGCNALDEKAIRKLYKIKKRDPKKPVSIIVSDIKMAGKYCKLGENEKKLVKKSLPLTLIVKKKKLPDILSKDTIAFRISGNPVAKKLSEKFPITATSANIAGESSAYSIKDINRKLKDKADLILDAGTLKKVKPSTILEIKDKKINIKREGPISRNMIKKVIKC